MKNNIQIMRLNEVLAMTQLSKTTLWHRTRDKLFPPSFKLGGTSSGYLKHEVIAVINAMATGSSDKELMSLVERLVELRKQSADAFLQSIAA